MSWEDPDFEALNDPDGPSEDDLARGARPIETACPECGRPMLDEAELCPHCGCWVRSGEFPERSGRTGPWVVALLLLTAMALLVLVLR